MGQLDIRIRKGSEGRQSAASGKMGPEHELAQTHASIINQDSSPFAAKLLREILIL
jgi:hypothetical protein